MTDSAPNTPNTAINVATSLSAYARQAPDQTAIAAPLGRRRAGKRRRYASVTFRELDEDSNRIASGLRALNIPPAARIVLMVRPGIDFVTLVFAMLKAGVSMVLIDPGMGRSNLIRCLEEVEPDGFIAIPLAQAIRCVLRRRFPKAKYNVTVGSRWFWAGPTLRQLREKGSSEPTLPRNRPEDPAAIIFTTGSTGPPKGVLYRHETFVRQVEEIRSRYQIEPGEIDLPGFPLFGLFNSAMGVTTVIPDMDPTRPADVDPENILEAARDWEITQSFGSPALWNTVGRYCEQHGKTIPTLRRVLSAGAPVPPHVVERVRKMMHPEGEIHTPYGATEALPIASISGAEILGETAERTKAGQGVCVGSRFAGMEWKVVEITDSPAATLDQLREVPPGTIGELLVRGAVVSREYITRREANAEHKVRDGDSIWHRMGDVGYLEQASASHPERFWFCGRKSHRVQSAQGVLFTIPVESIINTHAAVYRSALVGVGQPGRAIPVLIVETWPDHRPRTPQEKAALIEELRGLAARHEATQSVKHFLLHDGLPVDIRHNSKIFREKLGAWAENRLETR